MPSLATLVPLALVPALAFAAPVTPFSPAGIRLLGRTPSTEGLTSEQLLERQADSFSRLVRATKRNIDIPSGVQKRATTVTVPLKTHYDAYSQLDTHAGDISIGGQSLPVLFDTGSPDLVVPVDCKSGCANGFLRTASSPTFVNDTEAVSVTYGTGAADGYLAEDTVNVGSLTVEKQVFAAATNLETAGSENWAGIFGLAPGGGEYTGSPSFVQRAIQNGDLAANQFSLSIRTSGASELVLGGIDFRGIWLAGINSYTIDGKVVDSSVAYALVDSGSSFNVVPRSAAAAIYKSLNGVLWGTRRMSVAGQEADVDIYTMTCRRPAYVGRVGFNFIAASSASPVTMSSYDNVLDYVEAGNISKCFGAFYGVDIELTPGSGMYGALLGMPFLKSVYSVFSFDNDANGVAMSFSGVKPLA